MDTNIWDDVDPTAQDAPSLTFPIVFWLNGDKKLKAANDVTYTGGLFLTDKEIGREGAEIPNWKQAAFVGSKGDEVPGVAANQAYISIVRTRKRWFRESNDRTEYFPWNTQYEEGMRGQMHAIGFIRGLDEPVCFSFKGNAMRNIISVMAEHNRQLVAVVNRNAPKGRPGLPPYAVWMPVKAGPFESVGKGKQSDVTLPVIALPTPVSPEFATKCVVTREQLHQFQELYREAEAWAHEWDGQGGSGERDGREMTNRELGDSIQAPSSRNGNDEPEWPEPEWPEPNMAEPPMADEIPF